MAGAPKTYSVPWHGRILLACRKCQKKLKRNGNLPDLGKLKKTVKLYNREQRAEQRLHVINVPCMDLCPKDGVTVCCPDVNSNHLSILRSKDELHWFTGLKNG